MSGFHFVQGRRSLVVTSTLGGVASGASTSGACYANECTMPYAFDVTDFARIVEQRDSAPHGYEMWEGAVAAVRPGQRIRIVGK